MMGYGWDEDYTFDLFVNALVGLVLIVTAPIWMWAWTYRKWKQNI